MKKALANISTLFPTFQQVRTMGGGLKFNWRMVMEYKNDHGRGNVPPLMSLPVFFSLHNVSKALFYKLPLDKRPRVVRVGTKPMIRDVDAQCWLDSLKEEQ